VAEENVDRLPCGAELPDEGVVGCFDIAIGDDEGFAGRGGEDVAEDGIEAGAAGGGGDEIAVLEGGWSDAVGEGMEGEVQEVPELPEETGEGLQFEIHGSAHIEVDAGAAALLAAG
jgi:hypothetical protein